MKKYFALYSSSYGLTVKDLGEHENFDDASNYANEILTGSESPIWITDEEDLRGLMGSIQNALTVVKA